MDDDRYLPDLVVIFLQRPGYSWFVMWVVSLQQSGILTWQSPEQTLSLFESVFVGMINKQIISAAFISYERRTIVFYSVPEWRGKGTSRELLDRAVRHLKKWGLGRVYCISISEAEAYFSIDIVSRSP